MPETPIPLRGGVFSPASGKYRPTNLRLIVIFSSLAVEIIGSEWRQVGGVRFSAGSAGVLDGPGDLLLQILGGVEGPVGSRGEVRARAGRGRPGRCG